MEFNLDTPLMKLSGLQSGVSHQWTVRNAVEGVQIFGGIGSGKTSGSGRMLALKYLSHGFGGLVLTVKPDERALWEEYATLTGRSEDLIIVSPAHNNYFNFLNYESTNPHSMTENIVDVLKTVIHAGNTTASGNSQDPFWDNALDMLISYVIDLCKLAYGKVSVQLMYDIVQTLPKPQDKPDDRKKDTAFRKAYQTALKNVSQKTDAWESQRPESEILRLKQDEAVYDDLLCAEIPDARTMRFIDQFFWETLLSLSEKTRSVVDFSFSGFLFRLLRDPAYTLFCSHASTFTPEDCLTGKIIVLDMPVKLYQKAGRDCQIMFKYIWQRTMEKRDISKNGRPLFLWADEAQNFLHEHDADYQATARSSRIATVYISQNLPNYLANMGGNKGDFKVKSFLGTLATKIFHANADIETNRYASDLIGDGFFEETSRTNTASGQFSSSRTRAVKIDRVVRPEAFTQLKTGGKLNGSKVEGYIHLQGNVLDGANHAKIGFDQEYTPNLNRHIP